MYSSYTGIRKYIYFFIAYPSLLNAINISYSSLFVHCFPISLFFKQLRKFLCCTIISVTVHRPLTLFINKDSPSSYPQGCNQSRIGYILISAYFSYSYALHPLSWTACSFSCFIASKFCDKSGSDRCVGLHSKAENCRESIQEEAASRGKRPDQTDCR